MRVPLLLMAFTALPLTAQTTFTQKLRSVEAGRGRIIINQPAEIERIVNNTAPVPHAPSSPAEGKSPASPAHSGNVKETRNADAAKTESHSAASHPAHAARGRHKARGYRICIFTGGNSRADRAKAQQMGQKCRELFPELATYTNFQAPRWVTHAGDFRTRQDAQKYVSLIRRARFTYEVRIVGSEVNLPD